MRESLKSASDYVPRDNINYTPVSRVASHTPAEQAAGVLKPITPLAASATVINLVLATGPFTFPYAFVKCGIVLGTILMFLTMLVAYLMSTFMVEAISVSCAKQF